MFNLILFASQFQYFMLFAIYAYEFLIVYNYELIFQVRIKIVQSSS